MAIIIQPCKSIRLNGLAVIQAFVTIQNTQIVPQSGKQTP